MPTLAAGTLMGLGLISAAAILAWKRRQAQQFFAGGGQLPGAAPSKDWRGEVTSWQPAYPAAVAFPREVINPTRPGRAAYLVHQGRLVRGIDERRNPPHWGIDVSAPVGTPIYAAKDGVVIRNEPITGYGNTIVIQHDDGQSTLYAHLNRSMVRTDMRVHGGQLIGEVGRTAHGPNGAVPRTSTGEIATWPQQMGAHLHMEVHGSSPPTLTRNQRRLDPIVWLRNQGIEHYGRRS